MFNNVLVQEVGLEVLNKKIKKNDYNITIISEDFLFQEKIKKDFEEQGYLVTNVFPVKDEDWIQNIPSSACFVVCLDEIVKNKKLITLLKEVYKGVEVIIVEEKKVSSLEAEILNEAFTFIHNYDENKITLFLAARNAINYFVVNTVFDRSIRAFENYVFYMRDGYFEDKEQVIKNIEGYFNSISYGNNIDFFIYESFDGKNNIFGANKYFNRELNKLNSKEGNYVLNLCSETINNNTNLEMNDYKTYIFHCDESRSLVFLFKGMKKAGIDSNRLTELFISFCSTLIFKTLYAEHKNYFYIQSLLQLSSLSGCDYFVRDMRIFSQVFHDFKVQKHLQDDIVFYYLINETKRKMIKQNQINDYKIEKKRILSKYGSEIYDLFNFIRNINVYDLISYKKDSKLPAHFFDILVENIENYKNL